MTATTTTYTTLLSFSSSTLNFKKHSDIQRVVDTIFKIFSKYGFVPHSSASQELSAVSGFLHLYLSPQGSHVLLRGYGNGLITLDIHEISTSTSNDIENSCGAGRLFTNKEIGDLEVEIKKCLSFLESRSLPAIRRGRSVNPYYPTVDGRLVELDVREVVYEVKSKYQDIMIVRSESLGNILILDGDLNMGESDAIYSHTLMQKGKTNYQDKSCLVLGGGDGGLLYELLNEGAKKVILVDIDEEVISACQQYLRNVCHDVLDSRTGPYHQIIVDDAYKYLKDCLTDGVKFEYVLYDLTAVPVTTEPKTESLTSGSQKKEWEFLYETIKLSLDVLSHGGKFFCHATALLAKDSLLQFEGMLSQLNPNIRWMQHSAFIPSFHENFLFFFY
ncbi:hypothetical protein HELRODRAFT_104383 [Helobdella robusta]|uniref:PABS domain-containing protein n=1 Tax=Helobdella robusta TaxID=6412 RepID=T1EDL3_HELRO|nr:hypothetical protein HELRODRAFT_104383 [Helobdella robusta]ESN90140.1 hypothetical protein HELRODRAFT_104383 [Helobdella robusta]